MRIFNVWLLTGCFFGLLGLSPAQAQETEDAAQDPEIQTIESVLEKNVPEGAPKVELKLTPQKNQNKIDYSTLDVARKMEDTVVIQKIYMPKTNRIQLFGGFTYAANDAFFRTLGGQFRLGYHFNETWGVEATTFYLSSTPTQAVDDLAAKQNMQVENLTTPKSLLGVNAYFSTIYGKMALEERKIIPYEFYQTAGVGSISTNPASTAAAFYFGVGNIFSLSKDSELRADLSWFFYNGKTVRGDSQSANTIFVTIGYGRFLPEARTR